MYPCRPIIANETGIDIEWPLQINITVQKLFFDLTFYSTTFVAQNNSKLN